MKWFLLISITIVILSGCNTTEVNNQDTNTDKLDMENIGIYEEELVIENELNIGNYTGNITNGGFFAYSEGWIYFRNIFDDDKLYKIREDGSEFQKITDDTAAYINVNNDWIYYLTDEQYSSHGFFGEKIKRVSINGGSPQLVFEGSISHLHLINDSLYFINYMTISKMDVTNEHIEELPYKAFSMNVIDDKIYFFHHEGLIKGDVYGEEHQLIRQVGIGTHTIDEHFLYYSGQDSDYGIYRINLITNEKEDIVSEKVDYFNVLNGVIYYSTATAEVNRTIYRMDLKNKEKINLESIINSISIFPEFVIGGWGRQGFGSIEKLEIENMEWVSIYVNNNWDK